MGHAFGFLDKINNILKAEIVKFKQRKYSPAYF
jgi:hypothetical protein